MKIDPYLLPCTKLKPKWIKDVKIKQGTVNVIDENVEKALNSQGEIFLNTTQMAQALISTIDKWGSHETENIL